jgi:hypothetical protein
MQLTTDHGLRLTACGSSKTSDPDSTSHSHSHAAVPLLASSLPLPCVLLSSARCTLHAPASSDQISLGRFISACVLFCDCAPSFQSGGGGGRGGRKVCRKVCTVLGLYGGIRPKTPTETQESRSYPPPAHIASCVQRHLYCARTSTRHSSSPTRYIIQL